MNGGEVLVSLDSIGVVAPLAQVALSVLAVPVAQVALSDFIVPLVEAI
jgi:hypothetical protein